MYIKEVPLQRHLVDTQSIHCMQLEKLTLLQCRQMQTWQKIFNFHKSAICQSSFIWNLEISIKMRTDAENLLQYDLNASSRESTLREMGLVVIHLRRISVICKFKERSAARTISRSGKNWPYLVSTKKHAIRVLLVFHFQQKVLKTVATLVMGWFFHWRCNCPLNGSIELVTCSKIHIREWQWWW